MPEAAIFSKKNALSTLWLASTFQKKLTKALVIKTDLEESAESIVGGGAPVALRIRGQLLLGLVRIYDRKVRYLQEDCTDALSTVKLTIRAQKKIDLPSAEARARGEGAEPSVTLDIVDISVPDVNLQDLIQQHASSIRDQLLADSSLRAVSSESSQQLDELLAAQSQVEDIEFSIELDAAEFQASLGDFEEFELPDIDLNITRDEMGIDPMIGMRPFRVTVSNH